MIPVIPDPLWEIREALEGPDPRDEGKWRLDRFGAKYRDENGDPEWLSDAIISQKQWLLYKETGCYSQRFWIVQGAGGGHPIQYSVPEQSYLESTGREKDAPAPGSLPYAEYDQRVFSRIAERDRLLRWKQALGWDQRAEEKNRAGLWVRRDRKAEEEKWAKAMVAYMDNQIEEAVSDVPRSMLPEFAKGLHRPYGHMNVRGTPEELERAAVEDTSTNVEVG